MKILIDIGHPAHVHLFRHFAREMAQKGHETLFSVRQKEMNVYLLEKYDLDFHTYHKSRKGALNKLLSLPKTNRSLNRIFKDFRPDITLSHSSFYLAQVSWWHRVPNITLEDTGNLEQVMLYKPFTSVMMTPDCYPERQHRRQVSYAGYHELFYLHPKRYNADEESVLKSDGPYALVRFSAWDASHDIGRSRLKNEDKVELVRQLETRMKVYISAEGELPPELGKYRLETAAEDIHNVIRHAGLVVSEGATIASEAGVLGVPCIYINPLVRCYNRDLERYGLAVNTTDPAVIFEQVEALAAPSVKPDWQRRRLKMLAEKIDVTAFLVWFVENYPDSVRIMKEDPDYQLRFK